MSVASQRPVLELALETTEIRSQLSSIPIYTVVTDSNELVLVDREVRGMGGVGFSTEFSTKQAGGAGNPMRASAL